MYSLDQCGDFISRAIFEGRRSFRCQVCQLAANLFTICSEDVLDGALMDLDLKNWLIN